MYDNEVTLPQAIYAEHLENLNGIKFTHREIDIMACLIHGRATKRIASFLDINPKTVENHTRNIMLKLECNSRESIIDFVEKSEKHATLRRYYLNLLIYRIFEKHLKSIKIEKEELSLCSIVCWKMDKNQENFTHQLETDLKTLGINVSREARTQLQPIAALTHELVEDGVVIYVLPKELAEGSFSHSISDLTLNRKASLSFKGSLFLCPEGENLSESLQNLLGDNFVSEKNYYFLFFEILTKLFPHINFEEPISQFKEQYESSQNSSELVSSQLFSEEKSVKEKTTFFKSKISLILKNKWALGTMGGVFLFSIMGAFMMFPQTSERKKANQEAQALSPLSIQSEMGTPTVSALLERPHLLTHIDEKFKEQTDIQTVALIGMGGAGKTTLARQYAKNQKADVIWEINAETALTLFSSFEKLAQSLAKTEEEKRTLKDIQGIQNSTEREDKVIQFVKDRLKLAHEWLLIFDNVERFSDIQKYFPRNAHVWGKGKIIVTTRDSNIHSSSHIPHTVQVGELDDQEKITLFTQIMNHGEKRPLTQNKIEEAKIFLTKIPPLPLDISTAAYYIKTANISYDKYLERLKKYENDFVNIEENILKELNDYTKTRYNIITLSIKQLLDTHKDFADLLLLLSLLDSQNIPRNVLDAHKEELVVDNFIYHLKKYSLISDEYPPSPPLEATFSLHRSTQAIMLIYLTKELGLEKDKGLLQPIAHTLEEQVAQATEKANSPLLNLFQRHCEAFLSHEKLLTSLMRGLIEVELGRTYLFFGNYIKAKELLEKGYASLKKDSANNPKVLTYMGILYRVLGDYEKAISFLNQSLSLNKDPADKTSQTTAMTLAFLGEAYRETGNYEKAITHLQESFRICKNYYSDNKDECVPRALAHLGVVYRDQGDYEKARTLLEESHLLFKKRMSDTGMAMTLTFLGDVHRALGDLEKAKTLLEQALTIYKKLFSDSHLSISRARGYLGSVYGELGKYEEAKGLLTKSHKIYENHFGNKHVAPARFLRNLGKVYLLEGNTQAAEDTMKDALDIFAELNHPEAYISLEDLAALNLKKGLESKKSGKHDQQFKASAREYLNQALQIVKAYFPENSPHVARIQSKITSISE
jgi:tetratricopeptide (TPR) repeat protein